MFETNTDKPIEVTLHLFSECLLSKWGFGDGDALYGLICDMNIDEARYSALSSDDELIRLIETYLLPEARKHHDITVAHIETSHNPYRATHVDGKEVDWYKHGQIDNQEIVLTPKGVTLRMVSEGLKWKVIEYTLIE